MRRTPHRGIALLIACTLIFLVLGVVVAIGTTSSQNLFDIALRAYQEQAVYAAQAGLNDALSQVTTSPAWSTGFVKKSLPSQPSFSYTVTVTNNYGGFAPIIDARDGTSVPPGGVYLRSTGFSTRGVSRTVSAVVRQSVDDMFQNAIFAQSSISLGGSSLVDGWDSSTGPYAAPSTPQRKATLGTNATSNGAISLGGNSSVDGNLVVGPGAPPSAVSGASHATGTVSTESTVLPLPTPVPPAVTGSPPNVTYSSQAIQALTPGVYGSLSLSGGATLNLSGGVYYFTGNVTLTGNSTIAIAANTGPVVLYFAGTWNSSGGTISNPSGIPSNFRIYGTGSVTTMNISGGPSAYAVVYAPTASITVSGNAGFFGGLIGRTVGVSGNPKIHYDTSLSRLSLSNAGSAWTLTGVHYW